jgi:hypothetical protein
VRCCLSAAEDDHPVLLSHLAKYRSLMPALALIPHVIDGVDTAAQRTWRAGALLPLSMF